MLRTVLASLVVDLLLAGVPAALADGVAHRYHGDDQQAGSRPQTGEQPRPQHVDEGESIGHDDGHSQTGDYELGLTRQLEELRQEIQRLEITASELPRLQRMLAVLARELGALRVSVPKRLEWNRIEAELRGLAGDAGLEIRGLRRWESRSQASGPGSEAWAYDEGTAEIMVAGPPEAVSRCLASVVKSRRLIYVHEVLLPGAHGRMELRVFAIPDVPVASAEGQLQRRLKQLGAIQRPSTVNRLTRVEELEAELQAAWRRWEELQKTADAVQRLQARERTLGRISWLTTSIQKRPPVSVEREVGPKHLRAADLRLVDLATDGAKWRATVASFGEATLQLHAGDALEDGEVVAVEEDSLFVEARWETRKGKPPERRLLRFQLPRELEPLTLDQGTTWITSPLRRHGNPDYTAWLNAEYGAGVTKENNAAPALDEALAGLVDGGRYFWDDLGFRGDTQDLAAFHVDSRPWVESDCPQCVERLERNAEALTALAKAAQRPRYFVPIPADVSPYSTSIPSLLPTRLAANALVGRGMLSLGRGDLKGAAEDALTIQRLALLRSQGPALIEQLIAVAVRGIGVPLLVAIAAAPDLETASPQEMLGQLTQLPPMADLTQPLDRGERIGQLTRLLLLREHGSQRGPGGLFGILEPLEWRTWHLSDRPPSLLYLLPADALDWDHALRQVNQHTDLVVALQRTGTADERRQIRAELEAMSERLSREGEALVAELEGQATSEVSPATGQAAAIDALGATPAGRRRLAVLASLPIPSLVRASLSWNEAEAQFRLSVLAVALAVHRLEHGGYPARLEVATSPRLPERLRLATPAPGYVLSYQAGTASAADGEMYDTFVLAAVPEESRETGVRSFCMDSAGWARFTSDGSEPTIVNGGCDPELPALGS